MNIFKKIKRWLLVICLILRLNKDSYLVSFNTAVIGQDMLPYYRKALSRRGYHFHDSKVGYDGVVYEAWLKNGYVISHKMSDEESNSLYADNDIYETVVSPTNNKERNL